MPTYDYQCDGCDHKFELFQSIKDSPKKKCPECGKSKLRRLFGTGAAIMFKGSGFYITDYRSESYKKGAKADSSSNDGGSKTESKSGDTKSGETSSGKSSPSSGGESKGKSRKAKE